MSCQNVCLEHYKCYSLQRHTSCGHRSSFIVRDIIYRAVRSIMYVLVGATCAASSRVMSGGVCFRYERRVTAYTQRMRGWRNVRA